MRRKPKAKRSNLFANMTKEDWIATNEQSKKTRGLSGITFEDIYGEKTPEKVEAISKTIEEEEKNS